jgi:hypothetical protein
MKTCTRDTSITDYEFQDWLRQEHYLSYPLIDPRKIPEGYLQYWDEDDLCYRVAPRAESDRYDIMRIYSKHNNYMEDETVAAPEVVEEVVETPVEEVAEAPVEESPAELTEESVEAPVAVEPPLQ